MFKYLLGEIRSSVLSFSSIFYILVMPVGLYILFGALQSYSSLKVADGNAGAYVMIGMALYGALLGTTAISGSTVMELTSGWGRQLALTPLTIPKYLLIKTGVAFIVAALPIIGVNIAGLFTGIKIPIDQQLACGALALVCSLPFAFLSIAMGLLIRNNNAVGITSGIMVPLAFFGTVFTPLTEALMPYARFTPLYGAAEIARYPFTRGLNIITGSSDPANWSMTEPLWYALVNIGAWTLLFIIATLLLMRRATTRT